MLIAAKEFYDAEWCGVIDTDIELGFWTPAVWYHEGTGFNGKTLFKTRECSDDFPSWIKAFRERKSIIIQGEKDIEENYPEEKATRRITLGLLGDLYYQHKHYEDCLPVYQETLELCETDRDKSYIFSDISSYYTMTE